MRRWLLLAFAVGCAAPPPQPPTPLVLVTWNIHHGRGADGRVDLDRIAGVLRACAADVIALQEVDVGVARTDRLDLPAELARRLGMTAVFGHNLDFQGGQYGNALLTRLPVRTWRNHRYTMLRPGEQRGALLVELTAPAGPIVVVVTHLDYRPDDAERVAHVAELHALVAPIEHPVVLAGDFNAEPGTRPHHAALATLTDAWAVAGTGSGATYPADAPRKRIDWILLHGRGLTAREVTVVDDRTASDHRPVRAILAPSGD